ncbi:MAG: exodeoxyribonuclease VII large subunit [Bacteroidales bacterium]
MNTDMRDKLTLLELNSLIRQEIKNSFPASYWVIAEISEIKVNPRGHCYLDLVEKDELEDRIIAKARGTIWVRKFRMLEPYFESTTGKKLTTGLKILVNVTVEYHELYGFSLNVIDIDPAYTLGDLARKKIETINRLEEEGIINMNKELPLPEVPQKIAIISSETAAGYKDFIEQLTHNPYGYKFYTKLFPAYMQGEEAEKSIVRALENIYEYESFFDVVTIIRGGGAQSDLSCFDLYGLASNIAQFPLPVITGIGHEKDESVADIVAHTKQKTPTAVADFLINKAYLFEERLYELRDSFTNRVKDFLQQENQNISRITHQVVPAAKSTIEKSKHKVNLLINNFANSNKQYLNVQRRVLRTKSYELNNLVKTSLKHQHFSLELYKQNVKKYVKSYFNSHREKLNNKENAKKYLDPQNILKRGFSITRHNKSVIQDIEKLEKDDIVETILYKGKIESVVIKKTMSNTDKSE